MVKFGIMIDPASYEQMVKRAIVAEHSEFDSLWIADHIILDQYESSCLEAWSVLSAFATCTEKVTLGTAVTDPYRRHPAILAQTVATLDHISKSRAILGLGAGEAMNVEPFGIPRDRRITRMKETIEILRELWTGKIIDYHGKIFNLSGAFIQVPIHRRILPIYVAANSSMTRKLVGIYGDGWLAEMMSPERYTVDLKEIEQSAEKSGRRLRDIDATYVVTTAISNNYNEARETALFYAKRKFLWWPKQLQLYGYRITDEFDWNSLNIRKDTGKEIDEHISDVPDKPCEDVTIYGKPEDCIDKIEQYINAGVTHFEFEIVSPFIESCKEMQKKIIPYFKEVTDR